jgi:hypothetical protein
MSSTAHPSTVHRCAKCRQPTYLPTLAVALAVEQEPPKRGDPIPAALDGSARNCGFCGARIIPRHAIVTALPQGSEAPPPPPRGAPVPVVASADFSI